MPKTFLIFIGPPASGKGTQADKLGARLGLPVISPGELLRHERGAGTVIGAAVKEKMDRGELVPDEIIEKLLDSALSSGRARSGAIFDGYPRNQGQLRMLAGRLKRIASEADRLYVLYIKVSDSAVKERIGGRRACDCGSIYHLKYHPPKKTGVCDLCGQKLYQRSDDKPAVIKVRLKEFHRDSAPIIDDFRRRDKLIAIDGGKSIEEVYATILKEVEKRGIK